MGSGKVNSRAGTQQMQQFGMTLLDSGSNTKALSFDVRAVTNNRAARTETKVEGQHLCNHGGLQWYLLKVDYATKNRNSGGYSYGGTNYQYHICGVTGDEIWTTGYEPRSDFPAGTRYYLIGLDSDIVYVTDCFTERNNQRFWGFVAKIETKKTYNKNGIIFTYGNGGKDPRLAHYASKLTGLNYVRAIEIWKGEGDMGQTQKIHEWVTWMLEDDICSMKLLKQEREIVSQIKWDTPEVRYAEQFKNVDEVLRVGHLRFTRISDANAQKKANSVIDLLEWYGIIPILNVPKTVNFTVNTRYFKHFAESLCEVCKNTNLELDSGRYAIDIDGGCFFGNYNYRFADTKKGWILTSLANMEVVIDTDITDRIIPIGNSGLIIEGIVVEYDEFLNRI
jgi:hypothetical protein